MCKGVKVMNKNFKKECSVYIKSLKCNSCKKSLKMNSKEMMKQINAQKTNKTYKISKKTATKCNLKNYLLFSGAELGKCEKK